MIGERALAFRVRPPSDNFETANKRLSPAYIIVPICGTKYSSNAISRSRDYVCTQLELFAVVETSAAGCTRRREDREIPIGRGLDEGCGARARAGEDDTLYQCALVRMFSLIRVADELAQRNARPSPRIHREREDKKMHRRKILQKK